MTDTNDYFRQIRALIEAEYPGTAWNLFRQALREAYDAGYDMGNEGAADEETT